MRFSVTAVLATVLLLGCSPSQPAPVPAPEFDLELVSGGRLSSAQLKGKVVVVDFWATWCLPCKIEIPEYHKIMTKMNSSELEFVGVTFDSETPADVLPFLRELEIKYPITMATDEVDKGFGGHWAYPTTFLIGKDWKVYRRFEGATPDKLKELETGIEELLAAPNPENSES
jgi:thiol-disulfide isomerase/thioredoxin